MSLLINFVYFFICLITCSCASEEAIGENCREIPGDRTQIYPNCCPRFECDDEFGVDSYNIFEYGSNSL